MNDYRLNRTSPKILTAKMMNEIVKRQETAALMKARERIEDYQNDVFSIIENEGLNSEESKIKLETALKVLPYIIPTKKAIETTITYRKLEDIITESIEEAQIIDTKTDKTFDKITEQPASK